MARYRKIDTRIWNDAKFRELTDDGKLVFFFLLTHPHMTSIGAMRSTLPGLASEIGWLPERLSEAFAEGLAMGMVKHDPDASMVWLPQFIRYNEPESPNVLKAWASAIDLLPECDLTHIAIQSVKDYAEGLSEPFQKALPQAFRQACRQPSLYQEPEQEQEQEKKRARAARIDLPDWVPREAWDAFVEMRKTLKAPLTENAAALALRELTVLRGQGQDAGAVLEQSVLRSWRGLFAVKGQAGAPSGDWVKTAEGIDAKGREVGVERRPNETNASFRDRIRSRMGAH